MKEYITKENKEALEAELKELSGVKRREIISAIEYAKSLGDLSENAEYHNAREEQGKLEERIAQIDYVLKHAQVIDRLSNGTVNIGSDVVIQKAGETNTRTFNIVGSEETDMLSGKISYKSPLGSALFGKKKGDTVSVQTPKGEVEYEIISVI
jgi:transcription elongation factor GreA